MAQFSDEYLNRFGGPKLSLLTKCGADHLGEVSSFSDTVIWNQFFGANHPDDAVLHLELTMIRRAAAAADAYKTARAFLLRYTDGLPDHRLGAYHSAITHFEYCIAATWQFIDLLRKRDAHILGVGRVEVFEKGDGSDLNRLNQLNNVVKHFNAEQAEHASAPIWITNDGLEGIDQGREVSVSFSELRDNILSLHKVLEEALVEIPREAARRRELRSQLP